MKQIGGKPVSDVLKESVPNSFLNLTPSQFEEFVCELFKEMGYHANITKASGDFGADILMEKDGEKIAVQVKRYDSQNKVGVPEINQVLGAKAFYGCDRAMVITTSSFTRSGRDLAEKTQTELWDGSELDSKIKEFYPDYSEYYTGENDDFTFSCVKIVEDMHMGKEGEATIVHLKMQNATDKKIHVEIKNILAIDKLGNQFENYRYFAGGFVEGDIYPKKSVPLTPCWYSRQVPNARAIDMVVVKYTTRGLSKEIMLKTFIPESQKIITIPGIEHEQTFYGLEREGM